MEPQKKPIRLNENDTPYLYEPFRNRMPAKRPHPAEKEKILKPWQGLLVFAFLMVLFNLAGIPLVLAGGMYGNALDEIIVFLIGSILVVRALHIPLKEVFPLKKPDGAGILGTILMWYVTYRGVLALFLLMEWIFPQEYASLSESMDSSMAGLSYFGELLVVALTPAICEEALHRGLLQYSLRGIKKKWVMLLLMGVWRFPHEHRPFSSDDDDGNRSLVCADEDRQHVLQLAVPFRPQRIDDCGEHCGKLPLYVLAGERSSRQRIRNGNVHRHVSDRSGADADRSLYGKPSSDVPADKKRRIFPEGEKKKDHCKNRNSDHSADPWRTVFPWYWYDVKRIKSCLGNFAEMSKPGRKQVRFMIE